MKLFGIKLTAVVFAVLLLQPAVLAAPPAANPDQFKTNLQFITQEVLPPGWKLSAVLQWDAYGHDITKLAGIAAGQNLTISVLQNSEAAVAAAAVPKPGILRIRPANYSDLVEAINKGYGMQELASPLNIDDLIKAAKDTKTVIPVHLYMYKHHDRPWGWNYTTSQELQALVDSLDAKYVTIKGIMTHVGGLPDHHKPEQIRQFLQVACPVAAKLSVKPAVVHWVASEEAVRTIHHGSPKMQPEIPDACNSPNIEFWARFGTLTYGYYNDYNQYKLEDRTKPVFRWTAPVKNIHQATAHGWVKSIAEVDLSPARYPHPSWWANGAAYRDNRTLSEQYVFINQEPFPLRSVDQGGSTVMVDVTWSDIKPKVGDEVCVICDDQPLGNLEEVFEADSHNIALCLRGKQPVEGVQYSTPKCLAPGKEPFKAPAVVEASGANDSTGIEPAAVAASMNNSRKNATSGKPQLNQRVAFGLFVITWVLLALL